MRHPREYVNPLVYAPIFVVAVIQPGNVRIAKPRIAPALPPKR